MWNGKKVSVGRVEAAGGSVAVEQVSEVGGGLVMKAFVSKETHFKLKASWDREPVEVLENRGDVITRVGVGEQASSRVLDVLEFI